MYVFSRCGSSILLKGCPEIEEARKIIAKAKVNIDMIKDRNTFKVEAFVEPMNEDFVIL